MKTLFFATQIMAEQPRKSAWNPGIYRHATLKQARLFTAGVNDTDGKARTVRYTDEGIQEVK